MPDYFEQKLARRQERDRMFADWRAFLTDLASELPQVLPRLLLLRPIRREGEVFVIEYNEMHVDYLKHRTPKLYDKLSERCRMVKRGG